MDPLANRLRQERERQGLSVRDLAIVTKIREPYIEAVERGRYDVLPAVYVRSFVKTIAGALGIPLRETLALMAEVFDGSEDSLRLPRAIPPAQPPAGLESSVQRAATVFNQTVSKASEAVGDTFKKVSALQAPNFFSNRPRFIMVLALLLVVLLIIAFALIITSQDSSEQAQDAPIEGSAEVTVSESDVPDPTTVHVDSMILTANVTDTAWLTITMDGSRTQQHILSPREEYRWAANKKFVLNITNAGGVRFYRDGEPLPLFGKTGEAVRSIVITRTDVVSSAQTVDGAQQTPVPLDTPKRQQAPVASSQTETSRVQKPKTEKPRNQQQSAQPNHQAVQRRSTQKPARQRPAQQRRSIPLITPAPTLPPR